MLYNSSPALRFQPNRLPDHVQIEDILVPETPYSSTSHAHSIKGKGMCYMLSLLVFKVKSPKLSMNSPLGRVKKDIPDEFKRLTGNLETDDEWIPGNPFTNMD